MIQFGVGFMLGAVQGESTSVFCFSSAILACDRGEGGHETGLEVRFGHGSLLDACAFGWAGESFSGLGAGWN